jgi:hypothetical protein
MTASYIYALIRPLTGPPLTLDVAGIDEQPVRVVTQDDVAAVVSSIDGTRFAGAEAVKASLADLRWVEAVARAHDAVVTAAAGLTTTVPLRLGATCAGDDAVRELLVDLAPAARRAFERVDGCREWGVQLLAAGARSAGVPAPREESGTAFLRRRQTELRRADEAHADEAAAADAVFDALAQVSVANRRHPAQDRGLRTDARTMVLNASFLVGSAQEELFHRTVNELVSAHGADRLVLTGPWAPYSFAELTAP